MRKDPENNIVANNPKAFHDYNVLERYEAGIQLVGSEVKSCRNRAVQLQDGFVRIERGEAMLYNVRIAGYEYSHRFNHREVQVRRLLLHKNEILKLADWVNIKHGTIIPLKFYLKNGLVKVEIACCLGKNAADKRETMRKREMEGVMRRQLGMRNKRSN